MPEETPPEDDGTSPEFRLAVFYLDLAIYEAREGQPGALEEAFRLLEMLRAGDYSFVPDAPDPSDEDQWGDFGVNLRRGGAGPRGGIGYPRFQPKRPDSVLDSPTRPCATLPRRRMCPAEWRSPPCGSCNRWPMACSCCWCCL